MLVDRSPEWIRSIVNQCKAVGISVYVKQLGTVWAKQGGTHQERYQRGRSEGLGGRFALFESYPRISWCGRLSLCLLKGFVGSLNLFPKRQLC
jgi:hypothetical protein